MEREYLVTKLEAIDYHLEHGSVVIQRTKRLELPSETHVFPLKAKADSLEPPPEPIADRVIPPVPDPIIPQQSDLEYTPSIAPDPIEPPAQEKEPPVDVEMKKSSAEPLEPGEVMPDGSIAPDGYHYDGVRLVKTYKGSKRPRSIPSQLWKMMGPRQREKAIREEEQKKSEGVTSSSSKAASTLQSSGSQWEVLPARKKLLIDESFAVPCVPRTRGAVNESHRQPIRQMVEQHIKRLEFKQDIEMWAAVARLVSKEEVARTPKAREALDLEWNNLTLNGKSSERKVCGTKSLSVNFTRSSRKPEERGKRFIWAGYSRPATRKAQNYQRTIPEESLKVEQYFRATM